MVSTRSELASPAVANEGITLSTTAYEAVSKVVDPELRVVTIAELGILRGVEQEGERVVVTITPTYSGCPAMDAIRDDVREALARHGFADVEVRTVLSPAWSTDMITPSGHEALHRAGIAPPGSTACPHCNSVKTLQISRYASTPCQSLHRCLGCAEPFNAVKTL